MPTMASLEVSRAANDRRLARLVKALGDVHEASPSMPEPWRFLVAGYPIIAEDTGIPSLKSIADLALELHPYLGRQQRQAYHRRITPMLNGTYADIPPLMLAIPFPAQPPSFTSLDHELAIPYHLERTWFAWLADMVAILPDIDKKKSPLSELTLKQLLLLWCSTPLASFNPPIPTRGTPPSSESLRWARFYSQAHFAGGDER
ncbi:MAG: hypothetical protein M0R22_01255 [Dehalococcoidia bacterium]|nr:hypothetical protein [Dehalococcoidia bacterium]